MCRGRLWVKQPSQAVRVQKDPSRRREDRKALMPRTAQTDGKGCRSGLCERSHMVHLTLFPLAPIPPRCEVPQAACICAQKYVQRESDLGTVQVHVTVKCVQFESFYGGRQEVSIYFNRNKIRLERLSTNHARANLVAKIGQKSDRTIPHHPCLRLTTAARRLHEPSTCGGTLSPL